MTGYYACDRCGVGGFSASDLSGTPHTVKRHVSTTDLEELAAAFGAEELGRLRGLARDGSLAMLFPCGTFRRTAGA